ncbi:MAG: ATP-binding cassette domain-containing protein [Clostridia bacterium]|nr:ATP-binding cassette domain-containing protein [Clostridia bacterium]
MLAPLLMIDEELKMLSLYDKIAKLQSKDGYADNKAANKKVARYTAKAEIIANTLATEDVAAAKAAVAAVREGSVKGNLKADYVRRRRAEIEKHAYALLEQVGLSDKARAYPCELSGGQCQRVAIARALAMRPNILCFDEPTSALDPELTGEVLKVIKGLKSSDRTMIVVTHEMDFAKAVADKVIFMAGGIIEECGTPEEVFDNPKSEITKAFLNKSKESF